MEKQHLKGGSLPIVKFARFIKASLSMVLVMPYIDKQQKENNRKRGTFSRAAYTFAASATDSLWFLKDHVESRY